jgi:hypothetical protein
MSNFFSINPYDEYTKASVIHAGERALTARILRKENAQNIAEGAFEDVMRIDPDDGLYKPFSWFRDNKREIIRAEMSKSSSMSAGWNSRMLSLAALL